MMENLLCLGLNFSLFMVLLCVIFKSVLYSRAYFLVLLHAMSMYNWKQAAKGLKLQDRETTNNQ